MGQNEPTHNSAPWRMDGKQDFLLAIYCQKATQNPHMWFDMKEIKIK